MTEQYRAASGRLISVSNSKRSCAPSSSCSQNLASQSPDPQHRRLLYCACSLAAITVASDSKKQRGLVAAFSRLLVLVYQRRKYQALAQPSTTLPPWQSRKDG